MHVYFVSFFFIDTNLAVCGGSEIKGWVAFTRQLPIFLTIPLDK